ncbi:TolC family protein [bacterium]|nr:TolC family protein [bacterium]
MPACLMVAAIEETPKDGTKLVGGISLEDVFEKAKEHSYDLKIADFNLLISKQDIRGARSEYFPKLFLNLGTEYTKNFRDEKDTTVMTIGEAFINPYTRFQSILGITLYYNLFDFGVRGGTLKMAKEDVKIKELEEKEKLQELNLNLVDTYAKLLITQKQIEINKEIITLEEKNLEYRTRLYDAKEISKTELNDQAVKVSVIKNRISELTSIYMESLNWLSFYTGENYDTEKLKIAELKKSNFDITAFKDYTQSLTWQIHEKQLKKKEYELYVAKRNNYPKVNVYGKYYLYGSDHNNYGESLGIKPSNFSVGASVNMPVFDGMKNRSNIQKVSLELQQLQVERDRAIAQLMTRLATMRSNIIYLDQQINENNKAIKELKDKEKSTQKLASKRLISPMDLNDAKVELLQQKIELEKNKITSIAIAKGIEILTQTEN